VSISSHTRQYVQDAARERKTDQSAVVEEAIERMRRAERRTITQEALRAQADLDRELAERWLAASPPVDDDPW
jgi:hypothetical protein